MIRAQRVGKTYLSKDGGSVETLRDVTLDVRDGEFVAVVGPSGCGKTTLLKILTGLIAPDTGQVLVSGDEPRNLQGRIGYMAQADSLLPWRTVTGNVELGLELQGVPAGRRRAVAMELVARMGLEGFERSYPFELSGGMKKRVAIMRTLAYSPDIIFMDEPFGALDVQTRDMLEDDILNIWDETGKTIVFVTHDLSEAITLADRVLLMSSRPSAIIGDYPIDLPRPRSTDIRLDHAFNDILREIWDDLSREVRQARGGPHGPQ